MGKSISRHIAKMLKQGISEENTLSRCNCRQGQGTCPLNGNCQNKNIFYRAGVTSEDDCNTEYFTGLTSRTFKKRQYEHTGDKNSAARRHSTSLSAHIWSLKDDNTWTILDRAPPYNPVTKKCRLCLKEKYYIMHTPYNATINKRSEIWTPCRHRFKGLLEK